MTAMMIWKLEMMKYKRNPGMVLTFLTIILLVLIQSYTGFVTPEIPAEALYATGLDLLSTLVLPVLVPTLIVISHYKDQEDTGTLNLLLKGLDQRTFNDCRWLFYLFLFPILFLISFLFTLLFIALRGADAGTFLTGLLPYLLYATVSITTMVNISFLIYYLSKQNPLVPILLGLGAAIAGTYPTGDWLWLLNPYSYLNHMFSFRTFHLYHWGALTAACLISFGAMVLYYKRMNPEKVTGTKS